MIFLQIWDRKVFQACLQKLIMTGIWYTRKPASCYVLFHRKLIHRTSLGREQEALLVSADVNNPGRFQLGFCLVNNPARYAATSFVGIVDGASCYHLLHLLLGGFSTSVCASLTCLAIAILLIFRSIVSFSTLQLLASF